MRNTLFESFDDSLYIKLYFDNDTDGFVVIDKEHGKNELEGNKRIALLLSKMGFKVVLLPNVANAPTPDASIDEEIWEFKTITQANNLSNTVQRDIKRGKRQASNILIYIVQRYNVEDILKGVFNAAKFDEKELINKIAILFQNGRLIIFERIEVIDKSYIDKFYK
jgi:hypothetical protein